MKRFIHLLVALCFALTSFAQGGPEKAPVNPDYLEYQKNLELGLVKKATPNGFRLGERPSPIVYDYSKANVVGAAKFDALYDLRIANGGGWLTPVKDQGEEGACWAFATYGALESYWKKIGLATFDLSEQNLATCHGFDWTPSDGGNQYLSTAYLARFDGPISEADDPYTLPSNPSCVDGYTPVAYVGEAVYLPGINDGGYSIGIIKQAIIDHGALYVNMNFDDDYYNWDDYTFYYNGTGGTNHAVLLVGWDDNKVVTGGLATPNNNGAWIIRNSWGPVWGESGFFYISYEDTKALSSVAYFPSYYEFDSNAELYDFDRLGNTSNYGWGDGTDYGLMKIVASDNQMLEMVGTYAAAANSVITIEVYNDFSEGNLTNLLGSITNQTCTWPGYYTFEFAEPIELTASSDYYIKVMYNTGTNWPIPIEAVFEGYNSGSIIETGKYWVSSNGVSWFAIGQETSDPYNICIKAYATLAEVENNTVTDYDGNEYPTVTIGEQVWMAKNLRVAHYNNGDVISTGLNSSAWSTTTSGAWGVYPHISIAGLNSDAEVLNAYGALYNWYAVNDERGICPVGWRVPSEGDWLALFSYIEGIDAEDVSNQLKSCRQVDSPLGGDCVTTAHPRWNSDTNNFGTDAYGFNSLPASLRSNTGSYSSIGMYAYIWTSDQYNESDSRVVFQSYTSGDIVNTFVSKRYGFSVRCIKNTETEPTVITAEVTVITQTTATSGGEVTDDGGAAVTARGVVYSTIENPTLETNEGFTEDGDGVGSWVSELIELEPSTTYYVRAYATNSVGTAYGVQVEFETLEPYEIIIGQGAIDYDGNEYPTVIIGNQEWFAKNLMVTHYYNGDPIPTDLDETAWSETTEGAFAIYPHANIEGLNSDAEVLEAYGALYNWYTLNDVRGLCPTGWRVPTDAEWTTLTDYAGGESVAGGKLKSTRTVPDAHPRWEIPNTGATDEYAFSALPGGGRWDDEGGFDDMGLTCNWWGSTGSSETGAWLRAINSVSGFLHRDSNPKRVGFSVRCMRDVETEAILPTVTTTEVTNITSSSAKIWGQVTSNGGAEIEGIGAVWATFENPTLENNEGYFFYGGGEIDSFWTAASGLDPSTVYYVRTYATNSIGTAYGEQLDFETLEPIEIIYGEGAIDYDENEYPTVIIGNQEWFAKNLMVTHYNNGDAIPTGLDNTAWSETTEGAFAIYPHVNIEGLNSDAEVLEAYGALYNWYAVETGNLCPTGWRVPSDAEWTALTDYVGGESVAGGKLKSTRTWPEEHPRWDSPNEGATDEYGFSALPGNHRYDSGDFLGIGSYGYWWSSTESSPFAWYRLVNWGSSDIYRGSGGKQEGFSVRCMRDVEVEATLPTVTTTSVTAITQTTATAGGEVTNDGYAAVTARGVVYSTLEIPTLETNEGFTEDGTGVGVFESSLAELSPETTYYVRAYATNSVGTAYGEQVSFTTLGEIDPNINIIRGGPAETEPLAIPVQITGYLATPYATNLNEWTGSWRAPQAIYDQGLYVNDPDNWSNILDNGASGSTWSNSSPGTGHGILVVDLQQIRNITDISAFQMFSDGKTTHIALAGHSETGETAPDGLDENWVTFLEKSPIGEGTNNTTFISDPTKFVVNASTRYVKIMAYNDGSYGSGGYIELKGIKMYEGEPTTTVTDYDGNVYPTVIIGNQEWFAKNLMVTHYNNGNAIPTGLDNTAWSETTDGAFAIYPHADIEGLNSDAEVLEAYGALYNWYAVETGNLCPTGWHVPTDAEWYAMENYVDPTINDPNATGWRGTDGGGKLKSTRTAPDAHPRWDSPNEGATDEYGFSALPGGYRYSYGNFYDVGNSGYWWSGTELDATFAWFRAMSYDNERVNRNNNTDKRLGFSVRCMRDLEMPTYTVTFNVDMTDAIADFELVFDPELHDVFITGTFDVDVEWATPGSNVDYQLTNSEGEIYSITLLLSEGVYDYKYFIVPKGGEPTWDYGEWGGDPNRVVEITEDMEINDIWGVIETIDLTSNLVAFYPFNGNANDESGNENHGSLYGTSFTNDIIGNENSALSIDTKTDYMDIPDFGSSVISVSLWYYFGGTNGNWNTILCREDGYYHHLLINPSSNEIGYYSGSFFTSGIALEIGSWYHIVLIKDANNMYLYLNGEMIQQTVGSFSNVDYPLSIIGNYSIGGNQGALGILDQIRIYNRALSEAEVLALYDDEFIPTYTLSLETNLSGAAILNGAGEYEEGDEILISAIPNEGYLFVNWTDAYSDTLSLDMEFTYTMPAEDMTLTANFELLGDVNNDGTVNILDITKLINFIIGNNPSGFNQVLADVNQDGIIDVNDLVAVINLLLYGSLDPETKDSPVSNDAYISINDGVITLESDGTLAAIQFEINVKEGFAAELSLLDSRFMLAFTQHGSTVKGVVLSLTNTPIPQGVFPLLQTNLTEGFKEWGNLLASNIKAESVALLPKDLTGNNLIISSSHFNVYPNPTGDEFTVESGLLIRSIRLIDVTGQIILDAPVGANRTRVNVNGIRPGTYILQAQTDYRVINQMVVIMR